MHTRKTVFVHVSVMQSFIYVVFFSRNMSMHHTFRTDFLHMHRFYNINPFQDSTAGGHSHLWLAPWHWELWALCTSSSSLVRSSSSCSGGCCRLLTRMISCRRDSFSRSSCIRSRSRSASARSDQLSLSSCANWCCILCTLTEREGKAQCFAGGRRISHFTHSWKCCKRSARTRLLGCKNFLP